MGQPQVPIVRPATSTDLELTFWLRVERYRHGLRVFFWRVHWFPRRSSRDSGGSSGNGNNWVKPAFVPRHALAPGVTHHRNGSSAPCWGRCVRGSPTRDVSPNDTRRAQPTAGPSGMAGSKLERTSWQKAE